MSAKTGIEWTDATWNPIRGCSRVSEGCRNCYAETRANRFCGPGQPYEGLIQIGADGKGNGKWSGQIRFVEEHLFDPLRCKKPRRIFVNSMSDLFHENVTDEMLDKIFAVMALCPQHTFQVLTKRPERMSRYLSGDYGEGRIRISRNCIGAEAVRLYDVVHAKRLVDPRSQYGWPLPNVHLGVSVEDQPSADKRIPLLLQTPAAVRFISAEPLVWELKLLWKWVSKGHPFGGGPMVNLNEPWADPKEIPGLDWVIVGGESGPGARPMHPDWARSLRDQCVAAGVPFFFKQWGEWLGTETVATERGWRLNTQCGIPLHAMNLTKIRKWDGDVCRTASENETTDSFMGAGSKLSFLVGKKAAGRLLDGREWNEMVN